MLHILAIYALILVTVVVLGVLLSHRFELTHRRTQMMMSFVSGIMLGIALLHLLPHAHYAAMASTQQGVNTDFVSYWLLVGILGMFLLQRLFHFHQHDFNEDYSESTGESTHSIQNTTTSPIASNVGSFGVFIGLAVHSAVDGLALAAAIIAESHEHASGLGLAGLGVFVAIALHKPLDAITIDLYARRQGLSTLIRRLFIVVYALICPLAALLVFLGITSMTQPNNSYLIAILAFSAGIFLCIALSDLLPEIHFHRHDRFSMTVALILGVTVAYGITFLESEASHHMELGHDHHNEHGH